MINKKSKTARFLVALLGVALLLMVWQLLSSYVLDIRKYPTPLQVWASLRLYYDSGELLRDVESSLARGLVGFGISAVLGIIIGLLTGRNWWVRTMFGPVLHFLRALPPVAVLPLFILWYSGISEMSKIMTIVFGSFFPIWLNTSIGAENVPVYYLRNASLLTKSKSKILFRVVLPASMPFIIAGLRAGIANAFIMIFVSELAGANEGIGYTLSNAQMAFATSKVIAGLIILASLAMIMDWIIKVTFEKCFPWVTKM